LVSGYASDQPFGNQIHFRLRLRKRCLRLEPSECFFEKAIANNESPENITLDGSRASHQAVAELMAEGVLPAKTLVCTNKYLNNIIEQDHRKAPQRCFPMLGVKTFRNAQVPLSGIELANKIKKRQFDTSEITRPGAMILQVWEAVLAA
jgi:transposase-like protein